MLSYLGYNQPICNLASVAQYKCFFQFWKTLVDDYNLFVTDLKDWPIQINTFCSSSLASDQVLTLALTKEWSLEKNLSLTNHLNGGLEFNFWCKHVSKCNNTCLHWVSSRLLRREMKKRFLNLQFFEANREVVNLTERKNHLTSYCVEYLCIFFLMNIFQFFMR